MTSQSIATLLETRHAAELAYFAKSGAQNARDLDGLPRQMFDHLTAQELAEMAMIAPQATQHSSAV
jgi:hypothetical protein